MAMQCLNFSQRVYLDEYILKSSSWINTLAIVRKDIPEADPEYRK